MTPDEKTALYFRLFNEIGIVAQLTGAVLEAHLPHGLLGPHFRILNHLARVGEGPTVQAMAAAFQIPKTTVSHQVRVLARRDLVAVRANPADGRSKTVWTTGAGRALRADTIAALGGTIERWSGHVAPETVERLLPDLRALRVVLDADRDGDRDAKGGADRGADGGPEA